jgi:hypothetical protein
VRVDEVERRFRAFATDLDTADAARIVDLVLDWYVDERVEGVDLEGDGDMLLLQWGTHDRGGGPAFEYDVTRQLIEPHGDEVWQLSVTAYFPAELGAGLPAGDRWCSTPGEVPQLREFVAASPAMDAVAGVRPTRVEVRFEDAE